MTEVQKKNLETQLWGIANLLRGKISAETEIETQYPNSKSAYDSEEQEGPLDEKI